MSLRESSALPSACSGDMYDGVPTMWPSTVISLTGGGSLGIEGTARRGQPRQPEVEHLHAAVATTR